MSATSLWTMTKGKVMEGVFAINKPSGISSAQVIRDMQKEFNPSRLFAPWIAAERSNRDRENRYQRQRRRDKQIQVKIGHGGTLDPLATGVLITGVGKGTKALQNFLLCTKTYDAVVLFGASTDSYDRVGKILKRAPHEHITREMVEEALKQYRGKFMQLPPLYSALKMNGKPLYEYAREGKAIPREIERRQVEVTELKILEWMEGGTHNHKPPTEDAGHAEINIANKLWTQEGSLPASNKTESEEALERFESKKRKLSDAHDDLVSDKPPSKYARLGSAQDDTMSGGLPPTSSDANANAVPDTTPTPTAEDKTADSAQPEPQPTKGPPAVRLRMTVTSGFYVRSLCHDLGAAVGSAALMAELQRTRQGEFEVGKENVLEYGDLAKGEDVWGAQVSSMLEAWEGANKPSKSGSTKEGRRSSTTELDGVDRAVNGEEKEATEQPAEETPVKKEAEDKHEHKPVDNPPEPKTLDSAAKVPEAQATERPLEETTPKIKAED